MTVRGGAWLGSAAMCVVVCGCGGGAAFSDDGAGGRVAATSGGAPADTQGGSGGFGVMAQGGAQAGTGSEPSGAGAGGENGEIWAVTSSSGGTAAGGAAAGGTAAGGAAAGGAAAGGAAQGGVSAGGSAGIGGGDSPRCGLVINELQVGAADSPADEFVELYNSCTTAFALTGYRVVYRADVGTTDVVLLTFSSGAAVEGNAYIVLGGTSFAGDVHARLRGGQNGILSVSAGGVGLRAQNGGLVDSLAYGNAENGLVEGTAPGAPPLGTSIGRVPDGRDTNDNLLDFSGGSSTTGKANH